MLYPFDRGLTRQCCNLLAILLVHCYVLICSPNYDTANHQTYQEADYQKAK